MGTIHIGIRHDNNLMITQLGDIKIFMDTCTKSRDHGFNLIIDKNLIQTCFFDIQNLTSQRQNGLCGS